MSSINGNRQLKILVAENDEDDLFFLERVLKRAGIASLYHVSNGEEARSYLEGAGRYRNRTTYPFPDILLLDLKLPVVSGHEILEWLPTQTLESRPKVYVLSSSNLNVDRDRAERAGADGYFVKPLSLGHLAALFNRT